MSHLNTAYKLGALAAHEAFNKQGFSMPPPTPAPAGPNPAALTQIAGGNTPGVAEASNASAGRAGKGPSMAMSSKADNSFSSNIGSVPGGNPWTGGATK